MNPFRSLNPVTRRALRVNYVSPAICVMTSVSSGSGSGTGIAATLDILAVTRKAGPTNLAFQIINTTNVKLTWTVRSYIYSYVVYRATSALGPFTQVTANVIGSTFTDTSATTGAYYYKVTGVEPDAGETLATDIVGPVNIP